MLYVCIPVHNEAATVGVLLWRIRSVLQDYTREYEVVVYDDGSTDETAEVLEPYRRVLPLTVLRGPVRRGAAAAVDALVRHVVSHTRYPRRDAAVFMQGDFTDRPEDLPELAKRFEGGADLIVGRRAPASAQPEAERRLRTFAPWVLRPFVRLAGVDDLVTGFRLVRISVLRDLARARGGAPLVQGTGWAAQVDFALAVAPYARRVDVVDLPGRYDLRPRPTRLDWWRDLRTLAGYAWRRRGLRVAAGTQAGGERSERADRGAVAPRGDRAAAPADVVVLSAAPSVVAERPSVRGERGERPRRAGRGAAESERAGPAERPERTRRAARGEDAVARSAESERPERPRRVKEGAEPSGEPSTRRTRRGRARGTEEGVPSGVDSPELISEVLAPSVAGDGGAGGELAAPEVSDVVDGDDGDGGAPEVGGEATRRKRVRKRRRKRAAGAGEAAASEDGSEADAEGGAAGAEPFRAAVVTDDGSDGGDRGAGNGSDAEEAVEAPDGEQGEGGERTRKRRRRRRRSRGAGAGGGDDPAGADGTEDVSGVGGSETGVGVAAPRPSGTDRAAEGGGPAS